uniref:Phosphopantetheine adenylyltransferase n=1 Tax=Ditylenchus dipsaci TaxID=166011 RepID=A0A915EED1_9BILA
MTRIVSEITQTDQVTIERAKSSQDSFNVEGSPSTSLTNTSTKDNNSIFRLDNVIVGKTFDRLHSGHKHLISSARKLAKGTLTIGISGDSMEHLISRSPFESFLTPDLDCVVVTEESKNVAYGGNKRRKVDFAQIKLLLQLNEHMFEEKGLPELHVHVIDSFRNPDGQLLSATLLRRQENKVDGFYWLQFRKYS